MSYLTQEANCSSFNWNKYLKLLIGSAAFGPAYYNILEIKNSRFAFHFGEVRALRIPLYDFLFSPLPLCDETFPEVRLVFP